MDELIDILDTNGEFTGKTALKSKAHREGWFHPTVHIWLYTTDGNILLQQRGSQKDTHPLLWDVSVAGHIGAGEKTIDAALREVEEEVGLKITTNNLEKIGVFKSVHEHHAQLIDCEFHHVFLCKLEVPFGELTLQKSEVAALKLISLTQFSEETWGMAKLQNYVPHGVEYFVTISKAIKKRL